jgi:hypothetical protein
MRTYLAEHDSVLSVKVRAKEKRELQAEAERQSIRLSTLVRQALGLHEPV